MGIEFQRGDIVVCVISGDYGKPRPAVIVQSNLFAMYTSFSLCPITSHLVDAPLFRLSIPPDTHNGLKTPSQIMIDKIMSLSKDKIHQKIGHISPKQLRKIDQLLKLWLGLNNADNLV